MLTAIIIDTSAVARDLLTTILHNGGYKVVGHSNTSTQGLALALKHKPNFICADMGLLYDSHNMLDAVRRQLPKSLIFMISAELQANTLQDALARGVHGFVLKPFNATTVQNSIKKAVLAMVKRQQQAQAEGG